MVSGRSSGSVGSECSVRGKRDRSSLGREEGKKLEVIW